MSEDQFGRATVPKAETKRHRQLEERHRDPRWFAPWRAVNVWRDGSMVTISFPVEDPESVLSGEDLEIARDDIAKAERVRAQL